MKTAWDNYLDQQFADPTVRQAFEEETKVLGIRYADAVGISLDIRPVKEG